KGNIDTPRSGHSPRIYASGSPLCSKRAKWVSLRDRTISLFSAHLNGDFMTIQSSRKPWLKENNEALAHKGIVSVEEKIRAYAFTNKRNI
ncbi:hypothetical protein PIB30_039088, partial [Stylosanthes scabra]|nr:hypothetical protein [Stylosanthes scabra]